MTNQVIASRDVDGVVTLAGGAQIQVPKNRSMLQFLDKPSKDGSQYAEDGWVYVNGVKSHKWFIEIANKRVWEPVLKDLTKLEQRRFEIVSKCQALMQQEHSAGIEAMRKVQVSVLKRKDGYVKVIYDKYNDGCVSWGWIWDGDPQPDGPLNEEEGRAYFLSEKRSRRYGSYIHLFNQTFHRALVRFIYDNNMVNHSPHSAQRYIVFTINGREYWIDLNKDLAIMVWPEQDMHMVTRINIT